MGLWQIKTDRLGLGYFGSIYISAVDKDEAVAKVLVAFDKWIHNQIQWEGYHPFIDAAFPEDSGHKRQAGVFRGQFLKEAKRKIHLLDGDVKFS
jgi:hypothetical protein